MSKREIEAIVYQVPGTHVSDQVFGFKGENKTWDGMGNVVEFPNKRRLLVTVAMREAIEQSEELCDQMADLAEYVYQQSQGGAP